MCRREQAQRSARSATVNGLSLMAPPRRISPGLSLWGRISSSPPPLLLEPLRNDVLRGHPSPVAGQCMIVCRLRCMAPFAAWFDIVVVVRAAVLQRNHVLTVPIVGRAYLALAAVAASFCSLEDARSSLRRHAPALLVDEGCAGHNGTSANVSTLPDLRSLIGGMICETFSPVSASIRSATSSNSAHAARCGSVSKSIDLL